jgi:hypothetical protein
VDWGFTSARRQVGLKNLMLNHARKRHWATLRAPIVSSSNSRSTDDIRTYAVRQTDDGIFCAPTLKEVVTVRIAVVAHKLDVLRCGTRVTTRSNLPPSSEGDVRNGTGRTPLCERRLAKGLEKAIGTSKAQTDNVHRPRGARVSRQVPGALALGARNGPIVHG